jgi:hypothetical protein
LNGDELHRFGRNVKASFFLEFAYGAFLKRFDTRIEEAANESQAFAKACDVPIRCPSNTNTIASSMQKGITELVMPSIVLNGTKKFLRCTCVGTQPG